MIEDRLPLSANPDRPAGLAGLVDEASRQFSVCNACRYCEDYCAVFPAMEMRSAFEAGDVSYLANLCHDCRACHQACMFTDPHPFALDLPSLLTEVRVESYEHYARPRQIARVVSTGTLGMVRMSAVAVAIVLLLMLAVGDIGALFGDPHGSGSFYRLIPHVAMVVTALVITGAVGLAAAGGLIAFWRDGGGRTADLLDPRLWGTALWEGLTLRWMRGGGGDCYYPDDAVPSPTRRRFHKLLVYGFLATFASTVAAFIDEAAFGVVPPYGWLTVPVELGFWGGVAACVGATGLTVLKRRNARRLTIESAVQMDYTFLVAINLVSATGIALLLLRETPAMGTLLVVHLVLVFALILCAPYGKFVHAVYRLGALLRSIQERRIQAA